MLFFRDGHCFRNDSVKEETDNRHKISVYNSDEIMKPAGGDFDYVQKELLLTQNYI
jgi:hypothetical protein